MSVELVKEPLPCRCLVAFKDGELFVRSAHPECHRGHSDGQWLRDPETGEYDVDGAGQDGC